MKRKVKLGLVGATGLVGEEFIRILENSNEWEVDELRPFASERSEGLSLTVRDKKYGIQTLNENCFHGLDFVFFSSGDEISRNWAPQAVDQGCFVIDNSAAFRMDEAVPLVVPEVNGEVLSQINKPALIANPNCSTIQIVVALSPLHRKYKLRRIHAATYQAVSGAGRPAQQEYLQQMRSYGDSPQTYPKSLNSNSSARVLPKPIFGNVIPQIGSFTEEGECSEEKKIRQETKKILSAPDLMVSAFTVRVASMNVHGAAVWAEFFDPINREKIEESLKQAQGISYSQDQYVTPLELQSSDKVFVSRLHVDQDNPCQWKMWVVADNLRKGAALNGLQIAQLIFDRQIRR